MCMIHFFSLRVHGSKDGQWHYEVVDLIRDRLKNHAHCECGYQPKNADVRQRHTTHNDGFTHHDQNETVHCKRLAVKTATHDMANKLHMGVNASFPLSNINQ
jgi:hypothetical protein